MRVKDILNLYDCICSVAIIEYDNMSNNSKLNILWCGTYDMYHPKKLEYKELRKYLNYDVKSLSSFLNEKTNSCLQIYINL